MVKDGDREVGKGELNTIVLTTVKHRPQDAALLLSLYLDSLVGARVEVVLRGDESSHPVVLSGQLPNQLAGLYVPHLNAPQRTTEQLFIADGERAHWVVMGRHGLDNLQSVHVPHLDAVIHRTTEQKLLPSYITNKPHNQIINEAHRTGITG